jgi:hypothetical protein
MTVKGGKQTVESVEAIARLIGREKTFHATDSPKCNCLRDHRRRPRRTKLVRPADSGDVDGNGTSLGECRKIATRMGVKS